MLSHKFFMAKKFLKFSFPRSFSIMFYFAAVPLRVQYMYDRIIMPQFLKSFDKCYGRRAEVDLSILKSNLFFKDRGLRLYYTPSCMINEQCFYYFDKGIHGVWNQFCGITVIYTICTYSLTRNIKFKETGKKAVINTIKHTVTALKIF